MPSDEIRQFTAFRWRNDRKSEITRAFGEDRADTARLLPIGENLAVEEPLEIRLGGKRFTLTMRTPGHDEELAAGFLLAEGFVSSRAEMGEIRRLRLRDGRPDPNAIDVILSIASNDLRERLKRNFTISSSCGVCGKASVEALQRRIEPLALTLRLTPEALLDMASKMKTGQKVFAATGGLHAAALFTVLNGGAATKLDLVREDVGRHNAVDKALGRAMMDARTPLESSAMMVSGRLSFEIVQKAACAGIQIIAAVSAPSSLAVELADELGMTLAGFVRDAGFNVYTHPERILV